MQSNHVAVVTGGAAGMGRSICERFAARGDAVAVLDLDGTGAEQVAEGIRGRGGRALALQVDVSEREAVFEAFRKVRAELGPTDILVTSAAMFAFESFLDITEESWNRVMAVNVSGTVFAVQAALPDMLAANWGRIVLISSSSAQRGSPKLVHYTASKGAVIAMTKGLAREYASAGITVNTIPPSAIDTPMSRKSQAAGYMPDEATLLKAIPVGRLGTGEDIAGACAYLTSEEAGFVTGQVIGVNGGTVL
jgi:2-hydroxycyclohexanecarboxyl-CoA dehydrogenase